MPRPRPLVRSMVFNALGQGLPLVVGLLAIPAIIRGLGTPGFGALQIAWVVLGLAALFDLGLARATNKFVAEHVARGEPSLASGAVGLTVVLQLAAGLVGGLLLWALAPWLAGTVLNVPPDLQDPLRVSLRILALVVPVVLINGSLAGVLQALQHFGWVNLVQGPVSAASYALPVLVLALDGGLVAVVATLAVTRVAGGLVYGWMVLRALPAPRVWRLPRARGREVARFSGWVGLTNLVVPALTWLDRIVVGALVSLTAVAYYTAPQEVITRLAIVPAIVLPPVFSAVAGAAARGETREVARLYRKSLLVLVACAVPAVVVGIVVMRPALTLWLGQEFAAGGTAPARILLAGMGLNLLARLPFTTLQAVGRADLPALAQLLELPLFLAALWWLTARWGAVGAAWAWSGRMALDAVLLTATAARVHGLTRA